MDRVEPPEVDAYAADCRAHAMTRGTNGSVSNYLHRFNGASQEREPRTMMRKLIAAFAVATLILTVMSGTLSADLNAVTPSTNDINRDSGYAHFNVTEGVGHADFEFVSTNNWVSCFEYRVDGAPYTSPTNFNTDITDGLWPFTCVNNETEEITIEANNTIEIRMVFGDERDERFDWTTVNVLPDAQSREDCVDGGYESFGFANQGLCIQFVNTGSDSR
jgi:hypothetical protein